MSKISDVWSHVRAEEGGVLIGIVWVVLLLSILAVGVLQVTLISRKAPLQILERMQADNLAQSASVLYMHQHLFDVSGKPILSKSIQVFEENMAVQVELEDAKIDLNKADYHLLSAAIASLGNSPQLAEDIADAIIDWRDQDDFVTGNGAEAADYIALGLKYRPRNGPFETVGELRFVRGVSAEVFQCLVPLLTVYSNPAIEDVALDYASQDVRRVFVWARSNDWHSQYWPLPEEGDVDTGELDLSKQALTMKITRSGNAESNYTRIVRIKSTEDIVFSELRGLRKQATAIPTCIGTL